jgi:6-phosphogluconolactonase (cycloisomerase 2 family)
MKRQNNGIALCIAGMLMFNSSVLHAATPKFSIVPVAGTVTTLLLPSNFSEVVRYTVTNETAITRTLMMTPMAGVTQTTGPGLTSNSCSSPFTLASYQSCILTLVINGSQVTPSGIHGGPVICKANGSSPDPFLCSAPSTQNLLSVSTTSAGQHAYIANQIGNSISYCQVNPATGLLTNCTVTATGQSGTEGIGFNPAGTFFYSANPLGNSVSVCQVNSATGALSNCVDSGGTGFNLPDAVAFSPDGSIFYTSNFGGGIGSVSACLVNPTTGLLSSCVTNSSVTFSTAANMTLNSAGTLAYVVNRVPSTTSVCNVSGQVVSSCNNASGSNFNGPEGITLNASGLKAYIANAGGANITVCDVLQNSLGLLANCSVTNGEFRGTGNIGFNSTGSIAYVPNQLTNKVFMCQVDRITGALSACVDSQGTGFSGPAGVVLH